MTARNTPTEEYKTLQDCLRFKTLLVSYLSHEMRNPLNIIMGFTSIMLDEMQGMLNDEQKESLGHVQNAARQILAMVDDLVAISRSGVPGMEIRVERFGLHKLISEIMEGYRPRVEEKGLAISVAGETELNMTSDREVIRQCLINLIDNAVKYTETGAVNIRYSLLDRDLVLEVIDTGIGIAPDDCKKLFNTFIRLESPLKRRTPGTGLGLFLTAQMVRDVLGGTISCTCEPGAGTTFTLTIPQKLQESEVA